MKYTLLKIIISILITSTYLALKSHMIEHACPVQLHLCFYYWGMISERYVYFGLFKFVA
jgi:hypothetical protein